MPGGLRAGPPDASRHGFGNARTTCQGLLIWGERQPNLPYLVLPSSHYASQWATDREIRDCDDVTEAGMQYARETDPRKKQDLLLELIRYFHSYTFKYVTMIVPGSLPKTARGVNREAKALLWYFLPAGSKATNPELARVARSLCLAFKAWSPKKSTTSLSPVWSTPSQKRYLVVDRADGPRK